TMARPEGNVKLTARGLHLRNGTGRALPPANLEADVALLGTSARVDTHLTAGKSHVTVTGSAPLSSSGPIDLKTDAQMDLAILDPILSAEGRRARGFITVNAGVVGTA